MTDTASELLSDEAVEAAIRDANFIGRVGPELRRIVFAERAARIAAEKERDAMREALEWYGKQVRLSNTEAALDRALEALGMGKDPRVSKEANPARDAGRRALVEDNGNRARSTLSPAREVK